MGGAKGAQGIARRGKRDRRRGGRGRSILGGRGAGARGRGGDEGGRMRRRVECAGGENDR